MFGHPTPSLDDASKLPSSIGSARVSLSTGLMLGYFPLGFLDFALIVLRIFKYQHHFPVPSWLPRSLRLARRGGAGQS
ncbi:hypothetical protein Tco_0344286 [Tanacetum coccineum]